MTLRRCIRRAVIVAVVAKDLRIEEMGAREIRIQGERFRQDGASAFHVAFLHRSASDVDPAVGILRRNSVTF